MVNPRDRIDQELKARNMYKEDYIELPHKMVTLVESNLESSDVLDVIRRNMPADIQQSLETDSATIQGTGIAINSLVALNLANNLRMLANKTC